MTASTTPARYRKRTDGARATGGRLSGSLLPNQFIRLCLALLASVTLVLAQAQGSSTQEPSSAPETVDESLLTRGFEVYKGSYCGICHTLPAAQTAGVFGPPHAGIGVIATARIQDANYTGSATTAEAYLRESISDPEAYTVPGYAGSVHRMPAYTTLSDEDLTALVYMLLQQ